MQSQTKQKELLLEAAAIAEKKADRVSEPNVRDTMLALAALYRDMAKQIDELEMLRISLRRNY